MRYVAARLEQEQKEMVYHVYLTDALKAIAENTAKCAGGSCLKQRFAELLERPKQETRTGEEIAADVIKRAGLVVKE